MKKPDGVSATKDDLRSQPAVTEDGDVSQDAIWTAKFVQNMSEVADSMNISGAAIFFYAAWYGSCLSKRRLHY